MAQTINTAGAETISTPATHRNEFQQGIPWRVALQQSPPPLSPPISFYNSGRLFAEQNAANGKLSNFSLSQERARSSSSEFNN
jgi:hypothetical protein